MSAGTKIEWTDYTWPVVAGCRKRSPGCANCYATRDSWRLAHNPNPKIASAYAGATESARDWTGQVRWLKERLHWPEHWKKPGRIFVSNMAELFDTEVPLSFVMDVFEITEMVKRHTYQFLTKLPWRMRLAARMYFGDPQEIANIRFGFSAENQEWFDRRWKHVEGLADDGWPVFVSAEPLLEPITLPDSFLDRRHQAQVIVGGESGPGARPMELDWARSLRNQCQARGVHFFFKQTGGRVGHGEKTLDGEEWKQETDLRFQMSNFK